MKYYELTYLAKSQLSDSEIANIHQKLSSSIQEKEGVLDSDISPVKIILSYLIKKENQAYLATINFYLKPEKIKDLEKEVKVNIDILRFIIFNKKKAKAVEIKKRRPVEKSEKKVELKDIDEKLEEILK